MIPWYLDDGFTTIVVNLDAGTVLVRPLLSRARKNLSVVSEKLKERDLDFLFSKPHVWTTSPLSEEDMRRLTPIIWGDPEQERIQWGEFCKGIVSLFENANAFSLSCQDCRTYATEDFVVKLGLDGQPMRLPPGYPPPCESVGTPCPKGHWSDPREIPLIAIKAWEHYWKCKAADVFPSDCEIYARNTAYIDWVVRHGRRTEYCPSARRVSGGPSRDSDGGSNPGHPGDRAGSEQSDPVSELRGTGIASSPDAESRPPDGSETSFTGAAT
jgi:hypothetical protein